MCGCLCLFVCVLELVHTPQQAAAAQWNHLHAVEKPTRPLSNWDGFGGFKPAEGETLKHILSDTLKLNILQRGRKKKEKEKMVK